mmetsp:Transcript_28345/g.92569  ORF Transcript_28345/g.92569 Transcript_28345/m.92569 type:complete len:308 (+) Transcript_28345:2-925(+)
MASVIVVGGGRVGTYLACKMRDAGGTVVLKGPRPGTVPPYPLQHHVDALCKLHGVTYCEEYEKSGLAGQKVGYVFIACKTYDLPAVKAEMEESGIDAEVAVLIHNGIMKPLFNQSVRVVVPQSYDFAETPGVGAGVEIHVKNEEKPWVMPDSAAAKKAEELLTTVKVASSADPRFEYELVRKYFVNGVANLLSIVGNCNCNGLIDNHMETMEALYDEFIAVLAKPHAEAFAMMPEDFKDVVFTALKSYGVHFPSTKMDFDAGFPLEINSLNGYILACAQEQGIDVPANKKLVEQVQEMVASRDAAKK